MIPLWALLLAAGVPVDLHIDPCVEVNVGGVERLVGIELGALAAGRALDVEVPVTVGCRGDQAIVRLTDPLTEKTLERPVRLRRAAPSARDRLLALAIVELLVASWTELAAPAPSAAVEAPADAGTRRAAQAIAEARLREAAPPPARAEVRILAEVDGTGWSSRLGVSAGAGGRVGADWPGRLGVLVGVRLERASADTELGAVTFDAASVAPAVVARARLGPVVLRGGAGARLGLGRLTGAPANPERTIGASVAAAWGGPLATAGVALAGTGRLVVELDAEAGWVALPMGGLVAHVREVAADGAWFGGALCLGWRL